MPDPLPKHHVANKLKTGFAPVTRFALIIKVQGTITKYDRVFIKCEDCIASKAERLEQWPCSALDSVESVADAASARLLAGKKH